MELQLAQVAIQDTQILLTTVLVVPMVTMQVVHLVRIVSLSVQLV